MLLEVLPDETFSAPGHLPVIVGYTADGDPEYLCSVKIDGTRVVDLKVVEDQGATTLCTVKEGDTSVEYLALDGVKTTSHFWVVVLRYDPSEDTEAKVREAGGQDVTGQCFWS